MKYLSVETKEVFAFKDSEVNEILSSDIQISYEIYNQFFQNQSLGKQYIIKNENGTTFEEIFEEVIPMVEEVPGNTFEERLAAVEIALAQQLGGQNMEEWKKIIFVNAIRTRMAYEDRRAEDIILDYTKLIEEEKKEILKVIQSQHNLIEKITKKIKNIEIKHNINYNQNI